MSFAMGVIGSNTTTSMIIGIIIGLLGILGVSINYSLYKKLLNKGKMKKHSKDVYESVKMCIVYFTDEDVFMQLSTDVGGEYPEEWE